MPLRERVHHNATLSPLLRLTILMLARLPLRARQCRRGRAWSRRRRPESRCATFPPAVRRRAGLAATPADSEMRPSGSSLSRTFISRAPIASQTSATSSPAAGRSMDSSRRANVPPSQRDTRWLGEAHLGALGLLQHGGEKRADARSRLVEERSGRGHQLPAEIVRDRHRVADDVEDAERYVIEFGRDVPRAGRSRFVFAFAGIWRSIERGNALRLPDHGAERHRGSDPIDAHLTQAIADLGEIGVNRMVDDQRS